MTARSDDANKGAAPQQRRIVLPEPRRPQLAHDDYRALRLKRPLDPRYRADQINFACACLTMPGQQSYVDQDGDNTRAR